MIVFVLANRIMSRQTISPCSLTSNRRTGNALKKLEVTKMTQIFFITKTSRESNIKEFFKLENFTRTSLLDWNKIFH